MLKGLRRKQTGALIMSVILFISICFVAAVPSAVSAEMTPIEKINYFGDFEHGISGDLTANGNPQVFRFFKFKSELSTDKAYGGEHSLKTVPEADDAFFLFDLDLESNTAYDFSTFVYSEEGVENGLFELRLDGALKGSKDKITIDAEKWGEMSYSFKTGAAGKYRLALKGFKKDKIYYFDNIRLVKNTEMTPIEKINHFGDFEHGISGDLTANGNPQVFRFFKFKSELSTDRAYAGEHSLKAVPEADDAFFLFDLDLEANTAYDFSTFVYSEEGVGNGLFELRLDGALKGSKDKITIDAEKWGEMSYSFKTEAAGKYRLALKGFKKNKVYYFDDIKFGKAREMTPIEKINYFGDFEHGISGDLTANGNPQVFRFFKFKSELSTDRAYAGEHSLKSVPEANDAFFLFDVELEGDTQYTYSVYINMDDGIEDGLFELRLNGNLMGKREDITVASDEWQRVVYSFKTGAAGMYRLAFKGFKKDKAYYFDNIKFIKGTDSTDPEPPSGAEAFLTSFNPKKLIAEDADNLIAGGNIETENGALWNTEAFLADGIMERVSGDTVGKSGNVLHFTPNGSKRQVSAFKITLKPSTEYTLSFMVRGEYIGDKNSADMTFGIMNKNMEFLVLKDKKAGPSIYYNETPNSTAAKQLTPPSWDRNWHRRGCTFTTGDETEFYIAVTGKTADAYLDDIQLCISDKAKAETAETDYSSRITDAATEKTYCPDKYNLVKNGKITDLSGSYWNDGAYFGKIGSSISFKTVEDGVNAIVSQKRFAVPTNAYYVKWMDVEPNTYYTFSLKMKTDGTEITGGLLEDDNGYYGRIVGWSAHESNKWANYGVSFNSGNNTRIGFYITDSANRTEVTDIRLFRTEYGERPPVTPTDTSSDTKNNASDNSSDTVNTAEDEIIPDDSTKTPGTKKIVKRTVRTPIKSDYSLVIIICVSAAVLTAAVIISLLICKKKRVWLFAPGKGRRQ